MKTSAATQHTAQNPDSTCLSTILNARSIAIVGASDDPGKIAGRPLAYMLARGYTGDIYPVNPARQIVQGQTSYPSLSAIGRPIDLAIIGTAAERVETIVQEGIALGVKAFVIFSSGFAEVGEQGRAMQDRLQQLASTHGVAIIGPNSLGVVNSRNGLIASFTTALENTPVVQGGFAFASQSGALGAYWLDIVLRSGLGFSQWITTGNECNVDIADALHHLVDDEHTRVIGLYIEDIRRPLEFRKALQRAATAGKPVIAIKSGRSVAGQLAAASHTGALAGNDTLYDACLSQFGAIRVDSLTEMMDMARLLTQGATPAGRRLGVMSVSGGAGVLIADACEPFKLTLPAPSEPTKKALREILPPFVHPANPLDITGNVLQDTSLISRTMDTLTQANEVDAIVLFIGMMHSIADVFTDTLTKAKQSVQCPIIVIWVGAMEESIQQLEAHDIPVFLDIPQAIQAIARGIQAHEQRSRMATQLSPNTYQLAGALPATTLSEWDSKQLLRTQKAIRLPAGTLISETPGTKTAAPGFPAVAKLQSAELLHKSDAGGVILPLHDQKAVDDATQTLHHKGQALGIAVQGVLVEAMIPFDHELLLGLQRHPRFGPVLSLARGGIEAELDPDVVTRLLPLNENDIVMMLEGLRSAALLQGFRGGPRVDMQAISQSIARLCDWFLSQDLAELEINPLAVKGDQLWALDALITTGTIQK
ncbi:acetate--CoA ligase family protein [Pollutimonas harenae]|uniref:Acetate--CoA ligase family protein n=1 Tax=Pollutimonas harenae TaxID=657015 RepID=A0A853GVJ8_9BURK|nr:acetate--CoA ligase family protein [Pollutimonas harenae]NYT84152.1 acetate--CoA ligase family protein [Pollutimonas harenae]TEA73432.1 CoA-binding protein [Pollutimonas harenae]